MTKTHFKKAVPITIIAGFLGAGKTSLLTHILNADHGKRMAVLVNDFGTLNIDAELIVKVEGETVSLTNGCICCTIRDDLMTEVFKLLNQEVVPEHIMIETSGVSDPTLVAHTFQMQAIQGIVEVQSIISVVDADQTLALQNEFLELAIRQIKVADVIVINKVDLASARKKTELTAFIKEKVPNARIIEAIMGRVPLHLILNEARFNPDQLVETTQSHNLAFETWTYTSKEAFTFMAIRKALEKLPSSIYRAKGFIQLESAPEEQGVFQMTGERAWLRMGTHWESEKRSTRLVFIGKKESLNPTEINEHIDECQQTYSREALNTRTTPVKIENLNALKVLFG
ncbi:CobW family GTP-binding protein [Kordia sp.]|uniref:CobW family GTP-binding protein n=1 Tax=Kordia sp. TaxID=1965332 RepID=UPI003D6A07A0